MKPRAWLLGTSFLLLVQVGCGRSPSSTVSSSANSAIVAAPTAGTCNGDGPVSEACALPSAPVTSDPDDKSVDGGALQVCSSAPLTGWFRDGKCSTGAEDTGRHVVCAKLTSEFLEFTKSKGNDLVTPRGSFPGLGAGQQWCLCAARWDEAERAGVAPPVVLAATHASAGEIVAVEKLKAHATP